MVYKNNISAFDLREHMPGHVDIPRIRRGRVGGFFWSVYVGCKVCQIQNRATKDLSNPRYSWNCRMTDQISWCRQTVSGQLYIEQFDTYWFLTPALLVRDTLEQIDISKLLIQKYSDVGLSFILSYSYTYSLPDIHAGYKYCPC